MQINPVFDTHYSTDEHAIGTWIDGSTVYEKTISIGALPNATSKNVAHGITNIGYIVSINGVAQRNSPFRVVNIPYAHATDLATQIQLVMGDTYITIYTASDWSSFTNNYVTIRYIKTS